MAVQFDRDTNYSRGKVCSDDHDRHNWGERQPAAVVPAQFSLTNYRARRQLVNANIKLIIRQAFIGVVKLKCAYLNRLHADNRRQIVGQISNRCQLRDISQFRPPSF